MRTHYDPALAVVAAEAQLAAERSRVEELEEQREMARDHAGRMMAQRDDLRAAMDKAVAELESWRKVWDAGSYWVDNALCVLRAARSKP
jgi:hypothetical protein